MISAEYAGRAGLYSLNLDAQFTPDWGVGGGLSVWNSAVFSKLNSAKFVIVPVYVNYYWRHPGKHRIYSTLGASLVSLGGGTYPSFDSDVLRPFSAGGVVGTLGAGYEFRGSSGVLFRALPYWLARPGLSSFNAGLSLGYAF